MNNAKLNRQSIWNFKQNKPSLIVSDITKAYPEVNPDFLYSVLLARGVFKWLSVRRQLIDLKSEWGKEINKLQHRKSKEEKGYYKSLLKCRKKIRKLCHSERWVAPDNDRKAMEFLRRLNERDSRLRIPLGMRK